MLLGLDLGTTNVKASVALRDGRVVGQGSVPIDLLYVGERGVEQDLEQIWAATVQAIRQSLKGLKPSQVQAIGISSQGGAMQILNEAGKPLGRVLSWLDGQGQLDDLRFTRKRGNRWFYQHIGHGRSGMAIGNILRLRRENRPLLSAPHRVGFVGDIIVERLCGRAAHDGTSCGLTLLYNPRLRGYDPELLRHLNVHERQLPVLQSVRQAAGGLLAPVARQTGLTTGIPVSCAVHDQYTAALGTGVINAGDVMFGAGTAWVLLAVTDCLVRPVIEGAFVCHHVVEGLFGQILSLHTGGSAVSWIKKLVGYEKLPNAAIDAKIAAIPAGSDGLYFWPFVTANGAAELSAGIKAHFLGLQFFHTREHLIRAVIEGLSFELSRHLLFLRRARMAPKRIVMCGGAARSRLTPRIIADVTGLPVALAGVKEASVLGALIIARGLLEPGVPLNHLVGQMVEDPRVLKPESNRALYKRAFDEYLGSLRPYRSSKRVKP